MKFTERIILNDIKAKGRGFVFSARYFTSKAEDVSIVTSALSRLNNKGVIRRLAHGLYDYPEVHPVLGPMMPEIQKVIDAIREADQLVVQPTGAYAANLLGLSNQVPMKLEVLTNGPRKVISFGKQKLILKPTTPRNMAGAGTHAALIVQALRYMGKDQISGEVIQVLMNSIRGKDRKELDRQAEFAPAWIATVLRQLKN